MGRHGAGQGFVRVILSRMPEIRQIALLLRVRCWLGVATTAMIFAPGQSPAAEPTRFVFIADSGNGDSRPGTERKVAAMIKAWNPDFIVAAGDLAYEKGANNENVFK